MAKILTAEHASAEMMAVLRQEDQLRAQYGAWGQGAQEEITSLLGSFQAAAYRDEQGEAQIAGLEARLHHVESAAAEVRGRHDELYRTTN